MCALQPDLLHAQVGDLLVLRHLLISLGQTQVDKTESVRAAGPITCSSRGSTHSMTPAHITQVCNKERVRAVGPITCSSPGPTRPKYLLI